MRMRVLLDTNIIIHREASGVVKREIGVLFHWLDELHHTKCIHPLTISEIRRHKDSRVVASFEAKLKSYSELKTEAPETPEIAVVRRGDRDENSRNDTSILKEVFANRVDILITEDRGVHGKAKALGIDTRVFTIESFLEKVTAENPALAEYKVLSVRKQYFGNIDISD